MDVDIQNIDLDQCATGDSWFANTHECNRTTMKVNHEKNTIKLPTGRRSFFFFFLFGVPIERTRLLSSTGHMAFLIYVTVMDCNHLSCYSKYGPEKKGHVFMLATIINCSFCDWRRVFLAVKLVK